MGFFSLPSEKNEELMQKLNHLKEYYSHATDGSELLSEKLEQLHGVYLSILSDEKFEIDAATCANLAFLEKLMNPAAKDVDDEALQDKYRNMSKYQILLHICTYWRVAMWQINGKAPCGGIQKDYEKITGNSEDSGKLKFAMWKRDLQDNRQLRKAYGEDGISTILTTLERIFVELKENDEDSEEKKDSLVTEEDIKNVEKILGQKIDENKLSNVRSAVTTLKLYCKDRMIKLAGKAVGMEVTGFKFENDLSSDEFPEFDEKLSKWLRKNAQKQERIEKQRKLQEEIQKENFQGEENEQKDAINDRKEVEQENAPVMNRQPDPAIQPYVNDSIGRYPVMDLTGKDSDLMKDVKKAVAACENAMKEQISTEIMDEQTKNNLAQIEELMIKAIRECRTYCINSNPSSDRGKERRAAVLKTRNMLREQFGQLATLRRLIENPGIRQKDYPKGQTTIRSLSGYVKNISEKNQADRKKETDAIARLTYADFVEVLSPWNSDYVEVYKGKLRTATNVLNSAKKRQKLSETNRKMREQLARLALEREVESRKIQGINSSTTFMSTRLDFYRKKLGLLYLDEGLRPISMEKLREFIKYVDLISSRVNTVIQFEERYTVDELNIANAVRKAMKVEETPDFKTKKKKQIEKLLDIIAAGEKQGIKVNLPMKRIEELATGHMSAISDIAYSFLDGAQRLAKNFNTKSVGIELLSDNKEFMDTVMAFAVKIEGAKTEEKKEKVRSEARKYCMEYVFKALNKSAFLEEIRKYSLPELSSGTKGLREYVVSIFPTVKAWKGKAKEVAEGTALLGKVCSLLTQHRKLADDVIKNGKDMVKIRKLMELDSKIDILLKMDEDKGKNMAKMQLVAQNMPKTRFKAGIKKLQPYMTDDDFSYSSFDLKLMEQMVKLKGPQLQVVPQNEDHEQMLEKLQAGSRKIAEIFLMKSPPSDIISDNAREDAQVIWLLYENLKILQNNNTDYPVMNIGQATVEFGMNEKGHVYFVVDGMQFNTAWKPQNIIGYIEEDMCANVKKYGAGNVLNILGHSLEKVSRGDADGQGITEERLRNLLNTTLGIDTARLFKYSREALARSARSVLEKMSRGETVYADEVIRNLDMGVIAHVEEKMLDRAVVNSVNALKKVSMNGSIQSRIQFSEEFDKLPPKTDAVVWDQDEKAVKDLIADLIWPSEAWKHEIARRDDSANRMKYIIYNHADTIAMLIQDQDMLKRVVEKMKLKEHKLEQLNVEDLFYNEDTGLLSRLQIEKFLKDDMPSVQDTIKICERKDLSNIIKGFVGNAADARKAAEIVVRLAEHIGSNRIIDELSVKHMDIILSISDMINGKSDDKTDYKAAAAQLTKEKKEKIVNDLKGYVSMLLKVEGDGKEKKILDNLKNTVTTKLINLGTALMTGGKIDLETAKVDTIYAYICDARQELQISRSLEAVDSYIQNLVNKTVMPALQQQINENLNKNMFNEDEDVFMEVNDLEISDMLVNSITGESGQGLFYKKILQGYFVEEGVDQQRGMLASALREVKPSQITDDKLEPEKKNELLEQQLGSFMAGLFKGAGPLLHKTLQGFPTKDLSPGMKNAMDDMKSHLHSIPKALVAAQMNRIIEASGGTIKKIQIEESLGAASVGEAFLCMISDSEGKETEVVIKLLRPDVRRRMALDKEFFLKCAGETSEGMGKTFANQMKVYEQELDLCNESKNILCGRVYDEGDKHVKSEALANLITPASNYLALEKADGSTVGEYFKDVQSRQKQFEGEYSGFEEELLLVDNLTPLVEEMSKRQKFLIELAKKWVTEAIFKTGFYQADLHKDNIMISGKNATVIDYGNATLLSVDQKQHIAHMILCASLGLADGFAEHYAALLSDDSEKIYKDRETDFKKMISTVFGKKGDIGSKIAVVLMEAQKLGLELPTAVYNFSQGQLRLQNTIDDGNDILKSIVSRLDKGVKEHWKKDEKSILYEFRKIYTEHPEKDLRTIRKELEEMLGLAEDKKSQEEKAKNDQKIVNLGNRILHSDGREIKQLCLFNSTLNTASVGGMQMLTAYMKGKEKRDFNVDDLKSVGKQCATRAGDHLKEFISILCYTLEQEAELYIKAVNMVNKNDAPEDFLSVMSDVVEENQKKALEMIGAANAVKYTILSKNYEKRTEKWKENENKLVAGDIENLMALCKTMASLSGEMVKNSDTDKKPMTEKDQELIRTQIRELASFILKIPDWVMPLSARKYIIEKLNLFDEKKAMADLTANAGNRSKKTADEINWVSESRITELLNAPGNRERLYDLRNAMRLVRGYLERRLKSKVGHTVSADKKAEVDQILEDSQTMINKLKSEITPEEFKRIRTARQNAKNPAQAVADPDNAPENDGKLQNNAEEAFSAGKLFSDIGDIIKRSPKNKADLPNGRPVMEYVDKIYSPEAGGDDLAENTEYYKEYDRFVHIRSKLAEDKFKKFNSNDIAVLEKLKADEGTGIRPRLEKHLEHRIKSLEHIERLAEKADIAVPQGQPKTEERERNNVSLPGVIQKNPQNTSFGSWSVALASLLSYRGIDLDQQEIRAYRPDAEGFDEKDLADANKDAPNDLVHYTDLVQKLLPTTIVNQVSCNKEMDKTTARMMLMSCIVKALKEHNSPLALSYGGHYRTIYGVKDDQIQYFDPMKKEAQTMKISDMCQDCGYTTRTEDGKVETHYQFTAEWFQDMELNLRREPEPGETLEKNGAAYLQNELIETKSDYVRTGKFRGYISGEIRGEAIVSFLPTNVNLKDKIYQGFNLTALDSIAKKAEEAKVNSEVQKKLKDHPVEVLMLERYFRSYMCAWCKNLQTLHQKPELTDVDKSYIRAALDDVKYNYIVIEKKKLRDEIKRNFCLNGEITYPGSNDNEKLSKMRTVLEKAMYLAYVEHLNLNESEWLDRMNKDPFFGEAEKQMLKEKGLEKLLDQIEINSAQMAEARLYDIDIPIQDKNCSKDILYVNLLSEIQKGKFPETENLKKMLEKAQEKVDSIQKKNQERQKEELAELKKRLELRVAAMDDHPVINGPSSSKKELDPSKRMQESLKDQSVVSKK